MAATPDYETDLFIEAAPDTVWQFWVDPDRLTEWWGSAAELDPTPGGTYRVTMSDTGNVMLGEYIEVIPFERLVFLFGWDHGGHPSVPAKSSRVEVTLTPENRGTRLRLRHFDLPGDATSAHSGGWSHFLGVLQGKCAP